MRACGGAICDHALQIKLYAYYSDFRYLAERLVEIEPNIVVVD